MKDSIKDKRLVLFLCLLFGVSAAYLLWLGLRGQLEVFSSFSIFGLFEIKFYSLTIFSAFLVGAWLGYRLFIKDFPGHAKRVDVAEALLWITIPAIFFARVYHVLTDWHLYAHNPAGVVALWDGGVGFIGGVFGGALGLYLYVRKLKLPLDGALRAVVPVLPLCQAIGRLGNFFNQELFGLPTDLPWGQFIKLENRPNALLSNAYYHPLFLYESLGNLAIFASLIWLNKRGVAGKRMALIYIAMYGILRFLLDFLRISGRSGYWYLSYAQWLILLGFVLAAIFGVGFNIWFRHKYGFWFTKHGQLKQVGLVR